MLNTRTKETASISSSLTSDDEYAIQAKDLSIYYGDFLAVKDVNLKIQRQKITAIIGPSGCGKSTVLRAFNRMNELVPSASQKDPGSCV